MTRAADGPLTAREIQVLALMPTSLTWAEISERLDVSVWTVNECSKRIYKRLGVHRRADAVKVAKERGLLVAGQIAPDVPTVPEPREDTVTGKIRAWLLRNPGEVLSYADAAKMFDANRMTCQRVVDKLVHSGVAILRRLGGGNWSPVRIVYDPARQGEWPTAIEAKIGARLALFGVTYRVSRIEA
jgi:DNA-binding CsgD family transcriptional regulator